MKVRFISYAWIYLARSSRFSLRIDVKDKMTLKLMLLLSHMIRTTYRTNGSEKRHPKKCSCAGESIHKR